MHPASFTKMFPLHDHGTTLDAHDLYLLFTLGSVGLTSSLRSVSLEGVTPYSAEETCSDSNLIKENVVHCLEQASNCFDIAAALVQYVAKEEDGTSQATLLEYARHWTHVGALLLDSTAVRDQNALCLSFPTNNSRSLSHCTAPSSTPRRRHADQAKEQRGLSPRTQPVSYFTHELKERHFYLRFYSGIIVKHLEALLYLDDLHTFRVASSKLLGWIKLLEPTACSHSALCTADVIRLSLLLSRYVAVIRSCKHNARLSMYRLCSYYQRQPFSTDMALLCATEAFSECSFLQDINEHQCSDLFELFPKEERSQGQDDTLLNVDGVGSQIADEFLTLLPSDKGQTFPSSTPAFTTWALTHWSPLPSLPTVADYQSFTSCKSDCQSASETSNTVAVPVSLSTKHVSSGRRLLTFVNLLFQAGTHLASCWASIGATKRSVDVLWSALIWASRRVIAPAPVIFTVSLLLCVQLQRASILSVSGLLHNVSLESFSATPAVEVIHRFLATVISDASRSVRTVSKGTRLSRRKNASSLSLPAFLQLTSFLSSAPELLSSTVPATFIETCVVIVHKLTAHADRAALLIQALPKRNTRRSRSNHKNQLKLLSETVPTLLSATQRLTGILLGAEERFKLFSNHDSTVENRAERKKTNGIAKTKGRSFFEPEILRGKKRVDAADNSLLERLEQKIYDVLQWVNEALKAEVQAIPDSPLDLFPHKLASLIDTVFPICDEKTKKKTSTSAKLEPLIHDLCCAFDAALMGLLLSVGSLLLARRLGNPRMWKEASSVGLAVVEDAFPSLSFCSTLAAPATRCEELRCTICQQFLFLLARHYRVFWTHRFRQLQKRSFSNASSCTAVDTTEFLLTHHAARISAFQNPTRCAATHSVLSEMHNFPAEWSIIVTDVQHINGTQRIRFWRYFAPQLLSRLASNTPKESTTLHQDGKWFNVSSRWIPDDEWRALAEQLDAFRKKNVASAKAEHQLTSLSGFSPGDLSPEQDGNSITARTASPNAGPEMEKVQWWWTVR